jgi:hypothetical protein
MEKDLFSAAAAISPDGQQALTGSVGISPLDNIAWPPPCVGDVIQSWVTCEAGSALPRRMMPP